MAPRKPPSEAMVEFCSQINRVGRARCKDHWADVRPRQIEDWLQDALVHEPRRPGSGQRRGRSVVYTEEHVDRAVEVAELLRRHRSKDVAAAILFLRGRPIPEGRVRTAYLGMLARQTAAIEKAAERGMSQYEISTSESPEPPAGSWSSRELGEWAEATVADRLARSERTSTLRKELAAGPELGAELGRLAFGLAAKALNAEQGEEDLVAALLRGLGLPPDRLPALSLTHLGPPSVGTLRSLVERATLADFESARASLNVLDELSAHMVSATDDFLEPAVGVIGELESESGRALAVLIPLYMAAKAGIGSSLLEHVLTNSLAALQAQSEVE